MGVFWVDWWKVWVEVLDYFVVGFVDDCYEVGVV